MNPANQAASEVIFNKREFYIKLTRNVRWIVIVLIALTFPYDGPYVNFFFLLILAAVIYSIGWYVPWLYNQRWFGSFISMNAVDNLFVAQLVLLTGGLSSPFYLIFTFMAVTAAYWFGHKGLILLMVFHVSFAGGLYTFGDPVVGSVDSMRMFAILVTTFLINGYLAERLTFGDREERQMALRARDQVEKERRRLLSLINSMGDSVVAIDKSGRVSLYNGATLDLLDTNDQLIGDQLDRHISLTDENGEKITIVGMTKTVQGMLRRRDIIYAASDESSINLDITISPIMDLDEGKGENEGYIVILRDITKQKSFEDERDEFISVASHELRTPIAITEANLSTALMPKFAPENDTSKDLLEKAHDNVKFLAELVNDLSTLSRAEQGSLDVELVMMKPNELMERLASDYRERIRQKGLELKLELSDEVRPILTSESYVKEILQNFIVNAIKYTQTGSITLITKPSEKQKRMVIFAVKDTGIGVSSSDKKHVFEKFYRSEDYRTRETGGTGLGLYVTQKLARRLEGETWLESKLNKGSTFYLEIPSLENSHQDKSKAVEAQVDDFVSSL